MKFRKPNVAVEKNVEPPKEIPPPEIEKTAEVQPELPQNPENKLKAIVKVYPKDLIAQLIASGAIKERVTINDTKIILAVTIGTKGKVTNVEIRQGGGDDERGTIINFMSEVAASSWMFEPYLDNNGNPQELKTQLEFKPKDF